jgi:phospholipid/cholesterol/gamma-HCH transport system substrate-binding protein
MEGRGYALVVGVFVIVFAAGIIAAGAWLSRDRTAYAHYIVASKHGVTGLQPEAPVKLRGVTVGRVETIRFDPRDPQTVLVGIAVVAGTPIGAGTYAQLGYQGITGLSYIQLEDDPRADPAQRLAAGEAIEMRPSLFDRLTRAGPQLVDQLDLVLQRAGDLLDDGNRRSLTRSLANAEQATAEIGSLARQLKPGAAAIEPLAADARATLAKANEALARIETLSDDIKQRAQALDEVGRAAVQVRAAGKDAREVMPRLERLLDDLSSNSQNLNRLIADLEAHPQSVLLGKPPRVPGPGEPGFNGGRTAQRP